MSSRAALDASAVLALIDSEPGAELVASALPTAAISAVNYSEVVAKLTERGVEPERIDSYFGGYKLTIVPFDSAQARAAGLLRGRTRAAGLSFGDRACLALAAQRGTIAMTADRRWGELDLGLTVQVIR